MKFCIQFDTVKSRWSFAFIEGLQVIISIMNIIIFSLKIDFVLNSADPNEMPPYAAFHLGLHSLS